MSEFSFVNIDSNRFYNAYVGGEMYKEATWITMMAKSFKGSDAARNEFAANGTWMNRTNNIKRYSRVDIIA